MSDSKNSKGGAHLSDAHLPDVDEVKSPRPRQAGSMLMASARIEADANCRPGDSLTPVLRKHAATYAERVRTEAAEYMQQVGAGGELVLASMVGENSRALEYRSTVDRPDCVAIEPLKSSHLVALVALRAGQDRFDPLKPAALSVGAQARSINNRCGDRSEHLLDEAVGALDLIR